jgi:tetratricopeptide (TPR) repeat protein/tRNA A-37 threonylcarbamoyl transferase component Bud32
MTTRPSHLAAILVIQASTSSIARRGGGTIIGGLSSNNHILRAYSSGPNTCTWSNGTPVASGTNTNRISINDPSTLTLTLAASTTAYQVRFYVGESGPMTPSFTFALNDGSGDSYTAPAFTGFNVITVDYAASGASTLTMTFTSPKVAGDFNNIILDAVTVSGLAVVPEAALYALLLFGAAATSVWHESDVSFGIEGRYRKSWRLPRWRAVSWSEMITSAHDTSGATRHPAPEALASFGLGRLGEDESSVIAEHISTCDACRSVVEAVADDSLAGLFRAAHGHPSLPDAAGPASAPEDPPSGYELLEIIGEGGMGVVYRARQLGLGRVVALKQVRAATLAGRDGAARFRREAEAAARLRHPNIVPIYDVGRIDGVPYFAMEFVEGGSLADRLGSGSVAPEEAARAVSALALAVQHAHEAGIVHRDLKPGNVLLAPDLGTPKISDFGLAKRDGDGSRTETGAILGTPNYMAPEQAEGNAALVGPAADVYALGAILYEMLAGRPPFAGASTLETLDLVRRAEPTSPRRLRRSVSRDLDTIALKCLEKSPARRYDSARSLADDLRRHLDGEPIHARPITPPERLAKWARRRPWRAVSAALGVLGLIGLVAGTLVHNARLRAEITRTEQNAKEAREQRERADAQYRSARDAIVRMVRRFEDPAFAGQPMPVGFRRQILEDAVAFYEGAVRDDGPAEFAARLDKVHALSETSTFQAMLGRNDDVERTLLKSLALIDGLGAEQPGNRDVLGARVDCLCKLGLAIPQDVKRVDEGVEYLVEAIGASERLLKEDPTEFLRGDTLAWCHHNLGSILQGAFRHAEAEPHYRQAAEIRRALVETHPDLYVLRTRLAETLINLGLTLSNPEHAAEAESQFEQAANHLEPVVRDHPDFHVGRLSLCKLYLNWGGLALLEQRSERAKERYEAGLAQIERVTHAMPGWPDANHIERSLNGALAQAHEQAGRFGEAARCWTRAIELDDGVSRRAFLLARACDLARIGDGAAALADARATASAGGPTGAELYNMACVAALAVGSSRRSGDDGLVNDRARLALRWLEQARAAGLFHDPELVRSLDEDPDLEALRSRRDFQLFRLDAALPADPFSRSR